MEKRWVVRRSEPVKEVLLVEERVYPGGVQGTIELWVQIRFNFARYRCTRTEAILGTLGESDRATVPRWELKYFFRNGRRGHRPPSCFAQRVRNRLKTRELGFWLVQK